MQVLGASIEGNAAGQKPGPRSGPPKWKLRPPVYSTPATAPALVSTAAPQFNGSVE